MLPYYLIMNRVFQFLMSFLLMALFSINLLGQELHKYFEIKHAKAIDKIDLNVSTKAGKSFLNSVDSDAPLLILGASENDVAASTFKIEEIQNTQKVDADLTCKSHMGLNFTESVAGSIFSSDEKPSDMWQLNLSEHIVFNLSLNYLMGEANVDLSRLAIERLKIKSGSADVRLRYSDKMMNSVAMDTFFVKVNFGNIYVEDLNYSMAKDVIAEVGFGNLSIDCGKDWKINSRINASVGAGNLNIILPPDELPVIIRIHDSPLCNIKMADNFKKIGHNAFSNQAYIDNPENSMEFILDVGMGSIAFKTK